MSLAAVGTLSIVLCKPGEEADVRRRTMKCLQSGLGDRYDQVISIRTMDGVRGIPEGEEEEEEG
jgi:hypothetical protein